MEYADYVEYVEHKVVLGSAREYVRVDGSTWSLRSTRSMQDCMERLRGVWITSPLSPPNLLSLFEAGRSADSTTEPTRLVLLGACHSRAAGLSFVHAGVPPKMIRSWMVLEEALPFLAVTDPLPLLWTKTDPADTAVLDRPQIMGHLPLSQPEDHGHCVAIDTGAGRGGGLTALLLPEREFLTVGP